MDLVIFSAELYLDILREFVAVQSAFKDPEDTSWFMQDGVRPHRTAEIFNFFYGRFVDRVIALD